MNIFLDTTVFNKGKDVFLNGLYNKMLLNIAKQNKFKIYISKVVLLEARRQYEAFITSHVKNVKTAVGAFNLIPGIRHISLTIPKVEDAIKKFDEYYRHLETEGTVTIVDYSNDLLPTLVERAINRVKPFTEGKQEFRDAIIWLSYVKIAEEQELENCLFVTGNTTDYCDKHKELHLDLAKDSERFILYKDAYALVESDIMKKFKSNHESLQALREKKWSYEELIIMLKEQSLYPTLELSINIYISEHEQLGNVEVDNIDFERSWINSIEYIDGEYIMQGILEVRVTVKETNTSTKEEKQESFKIEKLDEISIVYQVVYNKDENKFNSIQVEDVYSELDYNGAHIYQDLH